MSSDRRISHGCGQKKTEGNNSAIFGVSAAVKCCELKRCAHRVRSRTDNKDEFLEGKFLNLNFLPSTKKAAEYSFELFLSIYRYLTFFSRVLNFTSVELNRFAKQAKLFSKKPIFQKQRWSCDFPPRKTPVAQSTTRFPAKKRWHFPPPSGCLGTPIPLP